jgi:hypothetical protein
MIYNVQMLVVIIVLLAVTANGFRMTSTRATATPMKMALADYREELARTAAAIAAPGNVNYRV